MKKVIIIEDKCIACGLCEAICDQVFLVEDVAQVIVDTIENNLIDDVESAINDCPTSAIEWDK